MKFNENKQGDDGISKEYGERLEANVVKLESDLNTLLPSFEEYLEAYSSSMQELLNRPKFSQANFMTLHQNAIRDPIDKVSKILFAFTD